MLHAPRPSGWQPPIRRAAIPSPFSAGNNGMPLPDLSGRVAVVTGASQGIGRGIALALADGAATIYVTGRNRPALEATAAGIRDRGGRPVAAVCDHTDDAQVETLFARIRDE